MNMAKNKSGKFCGAEIGELPRGDACVICDMFAKVMSDSGEKQVACPADLKVQLYRLKKWDKPRARKASKPDGSPKGLNTPKSIE
jgi:hypothetical protein